MQLLRLYRHRAGVARLVLNLVLLAGLLLLSWLAPDGLRIFADDALALVGKLPRVLVEGLVGVTQLFAIVLPVAVVAVLLWRRRFGLHLALFCDTARDRWGPLSARDRVPSLLDPYGELFTPEQVPELLAQARLEEVELEFRAQINATKPVS